MKKFHLFIGYCYYPDRFSDYRGSFPTLEDAYIRIKMIEPEYLQWWQILKTQDDGSLRLLEEDTIVNRIESRG